MLRTPLQIQPHSPLLELGLEFDSTDHDQSSFVEERESTKPSAIHPAPAAENLLEESRALVHTLPDTLAALTAGEAGYRQAQILVRETYALPDDAARELERVVLPAAGRLSPSQFDRKVRTARERLDPDSITARHERGVADRSLTLTPGRDGMCSLNAYLPAADGYAIHNRITALNRTGFGRRSVFTRTGFPGRDSDGNATRIRSVFGSRSRSGFSAD
jgi:hypothetical protein